MAYAAYREHPGVLRAEAATSFVVLDVTVCCADARRVRHAVSRCASAGVVRCEPLLHPGGASENDAPRVRLMIRLAAPSYAEVLHCLIETVPSGEIGRLLSWRDHLCRCGLCHGQ